MSDAAPSSHGIRLRGEPFMRVDALVEGVFAPAPGFGPIVRRPPARPRPRRSGTFAAPVARRA